MLDLSNIAEVKLSYSAKVKPSERPQISSSKDALTICKSLWPADTIELKEFFYTLLLDRANKVLGAVRIGEGGISGTVADVRHIFQSAILSNCSSLILAHNHPSGNTQPSEADIKLTRKIAKAGELHDIKVLDHVILTCENYYSFADEGMI